MISLAKFAGFMVCIALLAWLPAQPFQQAQTDASDPAQTQKQGKKKQTQAQNHHVLGKIVELDNLPESKIKVTVQLDTMKWIRPVARNAKTGDLWYSADLSQPGNYTIIVEAQGCPSQAFPDALDTTGKEWQFTTIMLPPCTAKAASGAADKNQPHAASPTRPPAAAQREEPVDGAVGQSAMPGHIPSIDKEVQPPPQERTLHSRSFLLTLSAAPRRRIEELLWMVALLGSVFTLLFQALAFFNRPQAAPDLSREIGIIKNDVLALEKHASSALSQWEKEITAAGARSETTDTARVAAPAMEMTAYAQPARYAPISLERVQEPGSSDQDPPRTSPEPVLGRDIVVDYELTRSAPDQEKAILQFESIYPYIRLSLVNQKEVEINPSVDPEFESSSRGYFLGVERNRQMLCFPWFSLDFSQPTFRLVFDYKNTGKRILRVPAELAAGADSWILRTRGQIENGS